MMINNITRRIYIEFYTFFNKLKNNKNYYDYNRSFLGVALEDGYLTESLNKKWLIHAYGENLYNTIKNQRIICIGTVWGTIDKLIEFSKVMWEKLDSKWSLRLKVIEQAVANYIIYHDKMFDDCLIKSENKNGLIMTIGLTKNENLYFDIDDNLVNGNGNIAAVIHQYDRKPQIIKKLMNKYFPKKENESQTIKYFTNKENENQTIKYFTKKENENQTIKYFTNKENEKQIIFILILIIIILIILCLIFKYISKKKSFDIINQVKIFKNGKSFKNNINNLDNRFLQKVNIK